MLRAALLTLVLTGSIIAAKPGSQQRVNGFGEIALHFEAAAAGSFSAQTVRDFPVIQSNCGIAPTARAYSMNVTLVPPGLVGFLTLWQARAATPLRVDNERMGIGDYCQRGIGARREQWRRQCTPSIQQS